MESIEDIYRCYSIYDKKAKRIDEKLYITNNNVQYKLLNYDKNLISYENVKQVYLYRSVIFSMPENQLISFSPQKTIDKKEFCNKYDMNDNIYINEYIDGTLIHLFYDFRIKSWEIATKNAITGNYKLFNKSLGRKTFFTVREMFIDAFTCPTYSTYSKINDLNNNCVINNFAKNYCYIFVLLHPDNPIIFPISKPKLYLTGVYDITPKSNRAINIPPFIYENWGEFNGTTIMFPRRRFFKNWEMLQSEKLIHLKDNEENCGFIATHLSSGERCKFYNGHYKELLRMKTIKSQFLLQYLCLRRTGLLNNYLIQYPGNRKTFRLFKDHFSCFVENLHTGYLMKYVWKIETDTSNKFNQYIDQIHREIFIPNIKNREIISKKKVFDFLMKKHPGEILYVLFSDKRTYS